MWKRIAAGVFGVTAICCGVLGCGYSVAVSADISQIGVPIWPALLGNALFWLLTIGAFGIGADSIKFAISGHSFRVSPRVRTVGIGVLSFFPAFLIALLVMSSYEVLRHPNDPQAFLRAFVVSFAFGLASVPVAMFLLRKSFFVKEEL
jgi:hypothetical protein